jgi:hypothetical protein
MVRDEMPDLPPFLRKIRALHRGAVRRGDREVPADIENLYREWESYSCIDGWQSSPRGRWVDYQLDWYEQRRESLE